MSNKELSNKELSNKELSNKELSNKELSNKELSRNVKKGIYCLALILILLTIDQIIKVSVKTNMALYDEIYIFDWFRIRFIEKNGMAWGIFVVLWSDIHRVNTICRLPANSFWRRLCSHAHG